MAGSNIILVWNRGYVVEFASQNVDRFLSGQITEINLGDSAEVRQERRY